MYTYKKFIKEREFNGTLSSLIEEIIKDFVNEEVGESELGEFYNIAGVVTLEEYGDFDFNIGIDEEINKGDVLEEETIRKFITERLLNRMVALVKSGIRVGDYKKELDIDSNIKGTYTLMYS